MKKEIIAVWCMSVLQGAYARAAEINPNIPGTNPTLGSPEGIIGNAYQFALLLGGLLAFGAIVYGSILYILGAANPEKKSEGKDRITQALLGLVLLLGAGIVLNLINPQILSRNPQGSSFLIKGLEGVRNTIKGEAFKDSNDYETFKQYEEQMKRARENYQAAEAEAEKLRKEGKVAEASALEKTLPQKKAEVAAQIYIARAKTAALDNNDGQIRFLRYSLDKQMAAAIGEASESKNQASADQLIIMRHASDVDLLATEMIAAMRRRADSVEDVKEALVDLESGTRQKRTERLAVNYPQQAEQIKQATADAMQKIKAECARQQFSWCQ